ncbi:hypothetical protein FIM12_05120 [SAR202 cluster bacterium AD-804-J14_MRT_500m]|nr:hypothetical protein [SAR202 cluster bacterium AD-804-J14_MRT_500m]
MANILLWLMAVEILGLITFPLCYFFFCRLPDRGIVLSPVLGLLLVSYVFWVLGLIGGFGNSRFVIVGILLVTCLVSLEVVRNSRSDLLGFLWRERFHIVTGHLLFLVIFVTWISVISQVPAINHTEKPMDFGILNAVLRAESFPPEDMWLAGHTINYYYFGHLMMGVLTQLTGIASSVTYNLSLALIAALASLGAYGLVYNLVRLSGRFSRSATLFALIAPLFVVLIGHLVGVLDFVQAQGWGSEEFWHWVNIKDLSKSVAENGSIFPQSYNWWWHSSRVIDTVVGNNSLDFTISEFPFFSFLLGDLHAHVLSLPFVILSLCLGLNLFLDDSPLRDMWSKRRICEVLVLSLSFGSLAFVNIWDLPVLLGLLGALIFLRALREESISLAKTVLRTLVVAVPIFVFAMIIFLPFYLDLQSQVSGVLPLLEVSTRPFYFFLVWGLFLFITVPFVLRQFWSIPRERLLDERLLIITVVVTLVPISLWCGVAFFLIQADGGLVEAAISVGSRFGKLLPLILFVGICVFAGLARNKQGEHEIAFVLTITALGYYLLMGLELFYIEDFLPLRMNTVFKLTYQAWLLLALASAFGAYYWLTRPVPKNFGLRVGNHLLVVMTGLILLGCLYYPVGAALNRIQSADDPPTLDGLAHVKQRDPDEYYAILDLRDNAPWGRIVEAVGPDYSDHGRIAASTGLPSLLNWPGHELQWRGSSVPFVGRDKDVDLIYRSHIPEEVDALLKKYAVRYVYVGKRERAKYGEKGLGVFTSLMRPYFQSPGVTVYVRDINAY